MKSIVVDDCVVTAAARVQIANRVGSILTMSRNEARQIAKWILENVEEEKPETPKRGELTLQEAKATDTTTRNYDGW